MGNAEYMGHRCHAFLTCRTTVLYSDPSPSFRVISLPPLSYLSILSCKPYGDLVGVSDSHSTHVFARLALLIYLYLESARMFIVLCNSNSGNIYWMNFSCFLLCTLNLTSDSPARKTQLLHVE